MLKVGIMTTMLLLLSACNTSEKKKVQVRFISGNSYQFEIRDSTDFVKVFSDFYRDHEGRFFIRAHTFRDSYSEKDRTIPGFIEIPPLDSNSFIQDGCYFRDNSKVICVFINSDGGNYVQLKDVDPISFKTFKGVFGGKDNKHVFFEDSILYGLDPKTVKIYSESENCTNCDGIFKDGNIIYEGYKRINDSTFQIPKKYKDVE